MILERRDLAWVESLDGRLTPFDEARLTASIEGATRRVCQQSECLAESVAAAVHLYARDCTTDRTIAADEIENLVASVLQMLDYEDVAAAYVQRRELDEIHLDEIATRSGAGFELNFFRQLDAALGLVADEELALLHLRGLRSCVMRLCGAQRWSAACRALAEQIVAHVRFRIAGLRPAHASTLQFAVLD